VQSGIPATTFSWFTAGTLFELEVNIDVESVVAFLYPCVVVFLVGFTSFCEPWSQIFEEPQAPLEMQTSSIPKSLWKVSPLTPVNENVTDPPMNLESFVIVVLKFFQL